MATQPTNLPVPSESPRDLKFNAGKIDEFVTSLVNTYVDRFGNEHYTIEGLRWLAQQAIAQYGWIPFGTFQDGATLTLPNQILKDETDGEYYRWDGTFIPDGKVVPSGSTPSSTGGTGSGAWISVGDSALRTMLANADGRKYIGKAPTIDALRSIEPTQNKQWIDVEKYWEDSLSPQGTYWHDASDTTSEDNGGTIIVTAGGKRWKFIGQPTVETYGAYADGRDDSAAFTRCIAAEDFISFPGDLYGVLNIQPIRNNQIFQGGSTTELRIITGGLATSAAFSFVLTYREGVVFRDFSISTDTVGLGKGFYSPSNIYVANPTIENINFKASLAFAIDANLILALVRDCWFGLEGTLYSSYMHVRCAGQSPVGSNLTTNANLFENCRFFRSNSAYGIDIQNGLQFIMRNCDFETNNNTSGLIRVAGILSVHFEECWWERNAGIQIVKVQMDSTGTTQGCQVISFDKCWIKLDGSGNTCALLSDTNNFNVSFSHCAGSQFAGKALFKVNTTSDPLGYLKFFTDNYLVGWSVFTQNNTWVPELRTNSVEYDDPATGVRLGKITANSSRIILSHNSGVVIQNSAGKVLAEVVTTATGTQIRALSQDGTTMWKLQPPTSGTTPTAAQWTPV
ncbi:TPA: hypothetical protein ACGQPR_001736 [Citrobacter amalonaticus]